MTILDVVDSAVKIGLGAAITAVATHLNGKANHSRDREKGNVERRMRLIEMVVKHLDDFSVPFVDYLCHCPVKGDLIGMDPIERSRLELQINPSPERLLAYKSKTVAAREAVREMTSALSLLNLIGPSEALTALIAWKEEAEKLWLLTSCNTNGVDATQFVSSRRAVGNAKKRFYEAVRQLYPVE